MARSEADPLKSRALPLLGRFLPIFTDVYRFLPICRTFLGDFNPQQLPSRGLRTLWEWKNRVLLEEYYSTLLYSTLLYFTLLYFTLDVVGGTPGGRALHGLFSKVACDMPPTGGLLGGYQGIAGDYAGIFPGDPSNNLGGLLDCHFIGLIILHMLSSKCIFFFRIRPLEELLH